MSPFAVIIAITTMMENCGYIEMVAAREEGMSSEPGLLRLASRPPGGPNWKRKSWGRVFRKFCTWMCRPDTTFRLKWVLFTRICLNYTQFMFTFGHLHLWGKPQMLLYSIPKFAKKHLKCRHIYVNHVNVRTAFRKKMGKI